MYSMYHHVTNVVLLTAYIIIQLKVRGKGNGDLYSASSRTPLTRSDMDHTVLSANNTISAFTRKHFQAEPPRIYA